jgi:hypothetical protein
LASGSRADVACLTLQIDNGSVAFTLLNVADAWLNRLMAPKAAGK